MKTILKILTLTAVVMVLHSYCMADTNTKTETFVEVIHAGDTVDSVLTTYYTNAEGVSYDEFRWNTLHLPENKHLLNKDGFLKLVQAGEKITVVVKAREQK